MNNVLYVIKILYRIKITEKVTRLKIFLELKILKPNYYCA